MHVLYVKSWTLTTESYGVCNKFALANGVANMHSFFSEQNAMELITKHSKNLNSSAISIHALCSFF